MVENTFVGDQKVDLSGTVIDGVTYYTTEQMERIICRNGKDMAERFRNEWIPMEEKYFAAYDIKKQADIYLKNRFEINSR